MWNKIVNPINGKEFNLNTKIGRNILENYINRMNGGSNTKNVDLSEENENLIKENIDLMKKIITLKNNYDDLSKVIADMINQIPLKHLDVIYQQLNKNTLDKLIGTSEEVFSDDDENNDLEIMDSKISNETNETIETLIKEFSSKIKRSTRIDRDVLEQEFWLSIAAHPNLKLEDIRRYKNNLSFTIISLNPNLTLEWLDTFPDESWAWGSIANHPNLTIEWLEKFPDESLLWDIVSNNPNLTAEWLEKCPKNSCMIN